MKFLVVPIEELKEFDVDWEYRRTNVAGTHALIHENLYNKYFQPMLLSLDSMDEEQQEIEYPAIEDNNDTYIDTTEIPIL